MSWRVGVIVFPMMWIYFQIKRLSKCALKRVACPTLVLCGRQDAVTPVALHEEIVAVGCRGEHGVRGTRPPPPLPRHRCGRAALRRAVGRYGTCPRVGHTEGRGHD